MEITDVKVFLVSEEKLKAFVSIVLDHCFMINDIKVIQGREGLFISMPSRRKRNGQFKDVAHPLNHETRAWMEDRILAVYRRCFEAQDQDEDQDQPAAKPNGRPAVAAGVSEGSADGGDEALDDVQRRHLSDSFWSMS